MKTFTDTAGRTWTIAVNVDTLKRVRALVNVNLLEVIEGTLIEKLIADPILLCDVLFAAVKPEADAKSISDVDFGKALAGDAIELATTALLEELVDFFPEARRRVLQKALQKLKTWQTKVLQVAESRLDNPELESQLEARLKELNALSA
jgi:hypothetical protein